MIHIKKFNESKEKGKEERLFEFTNIQNMNRDVDLINLEEKEFLIKLFSHVSKHYSPVIAGYYIKFDITSQSNITVYKYTDEYWGIIIALRSEQQYVLADTIEGVKQFHDELIDLYKNMFR